MSSIIFPKDHRAYLLEEFNKRNSKRASYSKRAFARDLELSPSFLVEYFSGKSSLSKQMISDLAKKLKLESSQKEHWIDLVEFQFSKNEMTKAAASLRMTARENSQQAQKAIDLYNAAAQWECWAYLELLSIYPEAQQDSFSSKWLKLKPSEFTKMKKLLIKLNIIELKNENWVRTQMADVFGGVAPSEAVREYHRRLMKKSNQALDNQNFDDRFFSSVILSVNKSKLKSIYANLEKEIYNILIDESAAKNNDSVYCFSFQFFNLKDTKNDKI